MYRINCSIQLFRNALLYHVPAHSLITLTLDLGCYSLLF
uniref:Uncharacterized protein n=1 Tax=Rhizophora mucronata TaxID=61149 RepID=A0A2P2Q2Y9_RHIMU